MVYFIYILDAFGILPILQWFLIGLVVGAMIFYFIKRA